MGRITSKQGPKRVNGKFVPNPNSKRQQKLRAMAQKDPNFNAEPAAPFTAVNEAPRTVSDSAGAVDTVESTVDTVNEAPRTDTVEGETPAPAPSHAPDATVDPWFEPSVGAPPPPRSAIDPDDVIEDHEAPKKKKNKREGKLFATMTVGAIGDLWQFYYTARHADYVSKLPPEMPGVSELREMAVLSQAEQEMLAHAFTEVIKESDFEMTPGQELAGMLALTFLPRFLALEGARRSIMNELKRQGKA